MRTPDESWRLFNAIELPPGVRQRVSDHIQRLRGAVPDSRASWAREGNLHLTVKFLGDTPVTKVEEFSKATQHAADRASPFELTIGGCGVFPPHGQPRVLWIGIQDPSVGLINYQRALEEECATVGFAREQRPFHPHLTIARLRQPQGSRHLAERHREMVFDPLTVNVRDVCVMRSELRSEGSKYTVISRHDLSAK
jgi:RNA 2',3'-cyclic 3'-phosphodiesterase